MENPDGLCEFDVYGSVPSSFDEGTQQLAVSGGGLTISGANCIGVFTNGDQAIFNGTYQLSNIAPVTIAN